jgi:hypothetical protein
MSLQPYQVINFAASSLETSIRNYGLSFIFSDMLLEEFSSFGNLSKFVTLRFIPVHGKFLLKCLNFGIILVTINSDGSSLERS